MNHDTVEVLGDEQVVTGVKRWINYKWRIWDSSYGFCSHWAQTKYWYFKDFLSLDETGYIINVVGTAKQI
jgi:thioredoxin reductase (NADPH)